MSGLRRAVFLDRDGTIIEESGYLDRLDRLIFFPYSVDAIRALNDGGFVVVVVTNQAGIARGIVDEAFVLTAHAHLAERVGGGGGRIDAFYYCPHHEAGIVAEYRRACDCRKPKPGLLHRAAADLGLDLARSFAAGDRWHDAAAGHAVGARGLLLRSGLGWQEERNAAARVPGAVVVDDLPAAAAWILQQA